MQTCKAGATLAPHETTYGNISSKNTDYCSNNHFVECETTAWCLFELPSFSLKFDYILHHWRQQNGILNHENRLQTFLQVRYEIIL